MADQKITGLTELAATPDDADIIAIVDDVAGTPVTKKITIANLLGNIGMPKRNETPTGIIDGINKVFTIGETPKTDSLQLFLNSAFQTGGGEDYTLVGKTITFVNAPVSGSVLKAFYYY